MSRQRRGRRWSALGATAGLAALSCSTLRSTERVFDGRLVQGAYVAPEAYAAYAEGAYREARGEWAAAEQAYRRALRSDGRSPQIWTRLGVLACRQSLGRALADFDRAVAAGDYAPAWTERARCLLQQRQPDPALRAALHAVRLAPRDAPSNLLVVRLYREAGRLDVARAWLFAWLLLEPELDGSRAELSTQARLLTDGPLSELVQARLAGHAAEPAAVRSAPAPTPALLQALAARDLERARALAREAQISPLELALLCTRSSRPELGLAQAQLLLDASPADSGALVAALLAAALLEDGEPFRRSLYRAQSDGLPPPALVPGLVQLLRTRVGDEAAESWHAAYRRVAPAAPEPAPSRRE